MRPAVADPVETEAPLDQASRRETPRAPLSRFRRLRPYGLVGLAVLSLTGYFAFGVRHIPVASGPPTFTVDLSEFAVRPAATSLRPGFSRFVVNNKGEIPHELTVVRTDRQADQLPVLDGEVWAAEDVTEAGAIHFGGAEKSAWGYIRLDPGRYVLLCNIKGHYEAGMRTVVWVK